MAAILTPIAVFLLMPFFVLVGAVLTRSIPLYQSMIRAKQSDHSMQLQLEGLRGLLALGVFLHHSTRSYDFFLHGTWGEPSSQLFAMLASGPVLFFFYLSGYLFWAKFIRKPKFSIRSELLSFYIKRLKRLYPALLLTFALTILIVFWRSGFVFKESPFQIVIESLKWVTLLGVPDINGYAGTWYIVAGVFWTLQMELFFYLALPFFHWFSKGPRVILLWVIMLIMARYKIRVNLFLIGHLFFLLPKFAHFFLVGFSGGILAATLNSRGITLNRLPYAAKSALVLAPLIAFFFLVPTVDYSPWQTVILFTPFWIVSSGYDCFGSLRSAPLLFLGTVSYSIYLFHGIFLYLGLRAADYAIPIAQLNAFGYWLLIGLIGALVIAWSSLTYLYVEHPFLDGPPPKREETDSPASAVPTAGPC